MITVLLAMYFLGGGLGGVSGSLLTSAAVKQLSAQSQTIITDPARAEVTQQTFSELQKEIKAFEKKFAKTGRQLNKSYKNHEADEEQAFAILSDLNSAWKAMQLSAIDLRFQLRDHMTKKEWAELFAGE